MHCFIGNISIFLKQIKEHGIFYQLFSMIPTETKLSTRNIGFEEFINYEERSIGIFLYTIPQDNTDE